MLTKRNGLWICSFCLAMVFCTQRDRKEQKPSSIYMEYIITGEEETEMVTGVLQFRRGKNGSNLVLKEPAKVELDGEQLQWDTAGVSGAFYEFQKPLQSFAGEHSIVFTDENGTEYKENFSYTPFYISNEPGAKAKRGSLVLKLEGLAVKQPIKVVMSDTSFYTEGVNEWDTVVNGQLDIRSKLAEVSNGPVVLQLYNESEKYIMSGKTVTGRILLSYGLRREFELTD